MNPQIIHQIQMLLDRYYAGESTPQEEAELQNLLAGEVTLPEHLQADADLFRQMCGLSTLAQTQAEEEALNHLPEGFEDRLKASLRSLEEAEHTLSVETPSEPRILPWARRIVLSRAFAACLSLVIVLGIAVGFLADPAVDPFLDTCTTPEQAEFQLNRALTLVNTMSKAGLNEARVDTPESTPVVLPSNRFISFE